MRTYLLLLATIVASAAAFSPNFFGLRTQTHTVCFAKHVNKKAIKWARDKRPKKSRPSDRNRKPIVYELDSIEKPPEYTISDEPASPEPKPEKKVDMSIPYPKIEP